MQTLLKTSAVDSSKKLVVRWWKNAWNLAVPMRGTLFFLHGIGEHAGRYDEFARAIANWGFDVVSFDYPGHGLSARKGAFERFADFPEMLSEAHDLYRFWLMEGPLASAGISKKPTFLLGHSLGSLLALTWLISDKKPHDLLEGPVKAILSSPPIGIALKVPAWKDSLAYALRATIPDLKMGNEITPDILSRDVVKVYEYQDDPLRSSKASPRLYLSLKETMQLVSDKAMNVEVPILVISGKEDQLIDQNVLKEFYLKLNTHKRWVAFDEMRHEPFNEIGREKVYEELLKWILS